MTQFHWYHSNDDGELDAIDHVIIDHDPDGCIKRDHYLDQGEPVPEITLDVVAYRNGEPVNSLGSIDFNRSDDWEVGKFTRASEISNDYLREIAKDMGLPE